MENVKISEVDLESILSTHRGNHFFAQALQQIKGPDEFLHGLSQYTYFSLPFGSGVANLAGEIAARHDLFRDSKEEVDIFADRSYIVAAEVFSAAIDEYDDRNIPGGGTHRSYAQATLKAVGEHFGYNSKRLKDLTQPDENTITIIGKIRDGYGINQAMDAQNILRAIGFHMASELLASGAKIGKTEVLGEFHILYDALRNTYPRLVEYLESRNVVIGGKKHPTSTWIPIHKTLEAEHFAAAMRAANKALQYYVGPKSPAKELILEGSKDLTIAQTDFMRSLIS